MTLADRLLAHLSRRTTSGQFIPEIDGLRFVSIAMVVCFHLGGYTMAKSTAIRFANPFDDALARLLATGHYGVQLFFIISGFVLALPFARHHLMHAPAPRLGAYYRRRLTRLEPPYIIAMTLIFAAATMFFGASARSLWPHLLASLAYVHNLVYGVGSAVNIVAWSLEVEVQFYLLAPLLAFVFAISGTWTRHIAIVMGIAAAILVQHFGVADNPRLSLTLLNQLQFFLLGFLIADVYITEWSTPSTHTSLWDVTGVLAWIALAAVLTLVRRPAVLFPLLACVVFCATFRGSAMQRLLSNRWLTTIGGMCYTIYLLHYPFISALGRRTIHLGVGTSFTEHFLIQFAIIVPGILAIGTLYFIFIERPCMNKNWPSDLVAWSRSVTRRGLTGGASSLRRS
jgi:peptidoglycan/LPS O-acetylase OafA/YrhL